MEGGVGVFEKLLVEQLLYCYSLVGECVKEYYIRVGNEN